MTIKEASIFLTHCRDIHQEWIHYLEKYPKAGKESEPVINIAGDVQYHTKLVSQYNDVIRLIESG